MPVETHLLMDGALHVYRRETAATGNAQPT